MVVRLSISGLSLNGPFDNWVVRLSDFHFKIIVFTFEGEAKNTMVDIKRKYLSKMFLKVLFLGPNFCKNLGFSSLEHCECGTCLFSWLLVYSQILISGQIRLSKSQFSQFPDF
jgi:hypothetical protein